MRLPRAAKPLNVPAKAGWLQLVCVLACVAASLGGSLLALRSFGPTAEPFSLGSVRVSAEPAFTGRVDVYVPIVDWGVRASPYWAPLEIKLRFRSINRQQARAALRSGPAAESNLRRLRTDIARLGRKVLVRAAALALVGGVLGGLLGGGFVGAVLSRRRWLAYGAGIGLASSTAAATLTLMGVRHVDYAAFRQPTFYAHGSELPKLLGFSEQLLTASDRYTESYEQALAGLANMVDFAGSTARGTATTSSILVASDLHSNTLVLPVLANEAKAKTVFFVGDFTILGSKYEQGLAGRVAQLGRQLVAVSGNHDSSPFMRRLARAGALVLTRDGQLDANGSVDHQAVKRVAGMRVAGFDDPLEAPNDELGAHALELKGDGLRRAGEQLVAWFRSLPERPDVVLVHEHGLAHVLLDALRSDAGPPLVIVTGHDHRQHLEQEGRNVLVDGGTAGAGGAFAIGVQPAGFAELRLNAQNSLQAVDLVLVDPISGEATARRVVVEELLSGSPLRRR